MNSVETVNPANSQGWKVSNLAIGAVIALLIATVGVESYVLYRARHHETSVANAETPAHSTNVGPVSKLSGVEDDWLGPIPGGKSGIPTDPWNQLNLLHQRMDQLFNNSLSQLPFDGSDLITLSIPNFDLREDADHYTIRADMPGTAKSSIKVNVEGREVRISGERSSLNETKSKDAVIRSERNMAQFARSIELPGPVKASEVDAKYDNGVLTITLPKASGSEASTQVPIH